MKLDKGRVAFFSGARVSGQRRSSSGKGSFSRKNPTALRTRGSWGTIKNLVPKIIVKEGHNRGEVLALRGGPVTFGRETSNTAWISDSQSSRHHARVVFNQGAYVVEDLKSRNGTWVNGVRVTRHTLRHMDAFRIGRYTFLYVEDGSSVATGGATQGTTLASTLASEVLIGDSEPMREVARLIERAASCDLPVLISGPSGTGKELVARSIQRISARRDGPFVVINCAVLPEHLAESELFGHEEGAFTGAKARKIGRFEAADGGTLFLDEVTETSTAIQAKLLRAVERGEYERLGGIKALRANVRVIAATNRDPQTEISQGRFREDLFYRLAGLHIRVPPLRERPSDLPLLCRHFIENFSTAMGKRVQKIDDAVMEAFREYPWPGNVRELRNVVERGVLFCQGECLTQTDLQWNPGRGAAGAPLEVVERDHIRRVLEDTEWNLSRAAEILGIHRATLYRRIQSHGLKKP